MTKGLGEMTKELDELFNALNKEIAEDKSMDTKSRAIATLTVAVMRQVIDDLHRSADALEASAKYSPFARNADDD